MGSAASSRPGSAAGDSRGATTPRPQKNPSPVAKQEKAPPKTPAAGSKSSPSKAKTQHTAPEYEPTDVMISYSHKDRDMMIKFRDTLRKHGVSVWVDVTGLQAGVDFLSKIGQAVIDAKIFVQLLSENSIASKYCQDELALAYISNKPIFPVSFCQPEPLFAAMDTGMKLQLARFNWNQFTDESNFEQDLETFVSKIKDFLEKGIMVTAQEAREGDGTGQGKTFDRQNVNRHFTKKSSFMAKLDAIGQGISEEEKENFWDANFKNKSNVSWEVFRKAFEKDYHKVLNVVFTKADQEWLLQILQRELMGDEEVNVTKDNFIDFCTVDGELQTFWDRIQDQAVESYTMKEVFDVRSSIRVEAIENLGKFRSKAVVEALLDLLKDKDFNVRAVAAISLARTGSDSRKVIRELMKCLDEKDRLVRESACLALGHLKAEAAISKLLHLWRNDFISSVREAAEVALGQIGGQEAEKAMHITRVLSDEIRMLTDE